jgi:uncharacterized protein YutE (UPF0331/DUF86 family)
MLSFKTLLILVSISAIICDDAKTMKPETYNTCMKD